MKTYRLTLTPKTAFGTPLSGETLFGTICWAIVRKFGIDRLKDLLIDYENGSPFAVVSDAFPSGYVPLPTLPNSFWQMPETVNRKYLKKKNWVAVLDLKHPVCEWRNLAKTDEELAADKGARFKAEAVALHNTINRSTGCTGEGEFAPHMQREFWYNRAVSMDIYVVLDETRCSADELMQWVQYVGMVGYGRDASCGLGKFEILKAPQEIEERPASTCFMTLASAVLNGISGVVPEKSFYRARTHFGRHGAELAVGGMPFKKPILLAQSGAVVTLESAQSVRFLGRGLVGVSSAYPETVHQGYSPVLALSEMENNK